MNIVVFLPTFRRPETLVWSLYSAMLQDVVPRTQSARIIVLNNDSETNAVERAVEQARALVPDTAWSVELVHRDPPMDPVLSWYGGIRELAPEGAFVFLHGDDDLLLDGSVAARVRQLQDSDADLLLTRSGAGLFFHGAMADQAIVVDVPLAAADSGTWNVLAASEILGYGPAFIGNHAYRSTPALWRAYDRTMARMIKLPVAGTQQRAMLPYILPIDIATEGKVVGSAIVGCIRGQKTTEVFNGHQNWTPGLLYAAALSVLDQDDFAGRPDLDVWRRALEAEIAAWLVPTLIGKRTRREVVPLLRSMGLHRVFLRPKKLAEGVALVCASKLKLRGRRLRLALPTGLRATADLVPSLLRGLDYSRQQT